MSKQRDDAPQWIESTKSSSIYIFFQRYRKFFDSSNLDLAKKHLLSTTKLMSAEVKNSQVIMGIVLPILTKFLQKSQIRTAPLLQEVAKHSVR